ncbi:MAG: 4Fe-4S dicluster domain-containing protein [Promethearchaeota archaeon]|nr:MAG: 4Fe-4S dicluster domain-containing protein [Candidatus Lokiarchaeota archaeon]
MPECPLAISDKGSIGATGDWRTFRPVIDQEKCTKCMTCWAYCPEGVIYVENDKMIIDYTYCKGCLICFNECPVNAISREREKI